MKTLKTMVVSLAAIVILGNSVTAFSQSCENSGWGASQNIISGPEYVINNAQNKFKISADSFDQYGQTVSFWTSEDGYIGNSSFTTIEGSELKAISHIRFNSSAGTAHIVAEWGNGNVTCKNVSIQNTKPIITQIRVENLTHRQGQLTGRIKVIGQVDSYSKYSNNPKHTLKIKCDTYTSFQKVLNKSSSNYYDFSMPCNFTVKATVYDGTFYSAEENRDIRFSDVSNSDSGPNSAACLARCPTTLNPQGRSWCMQSNPVCHI